MSLLALTGIAVLAAVLCATLAWRVRRDDQQRSAARVASLAAAIDAESMAAGMAVPVHVGALFARRDATHMERRPLITVAAIAGLAVMLLVAAGVQWNASSGGEQPPVSSGAPLELMSMAHARERDTFTVRGLVRNPRNGRTVERVAAVVFVFDRQGNYVTSNRAAVDFVTLEPGDESPFVVSVPRAGDVGRYRVTFRTDLGVVRHIDRREAAAQPAHTE